MKVTIVYCYDAYCGWCYGFSTVIKKLWSEFRDRCNFEVLSGGLILPKSPVPVSATAPYIRKAYKNVEELTGVTFGSDYLWHINNPEKSDWYPHSEKPAIAPCIFKEFYPEEQVKFATDLQYALHFEGRDLCDDEAYRHLLIRYNIVAHDFYEKLQLPGYKEMAYDEFALVQQLKVNSYPTVLVQATSSKFYLVNVGYSSYEEVKLNLERILAGLSNDHTD